MAAGAAGSSTTMALCPKRSKNSSPGCIVSTPMRGVATAVAAMSHSTEARRIRRNALCLGMHAHVEGVQPPRIGARDAEAEATQRQFLARLRQMSDRRGEQAADGVVLV